MDLNCVGPLICEFFSINTTTVLYNLQLAESTDKKPGIQGTNCKVILEFSAVWRVCAPNSHVVQGSTVFFSV